MADRFFVNLEKPKYPHLVRPGGGLSGEMYDLRDDISRAFDRVDDGCASSISAETHLYVDASAGDDSNDGSSWSLAVKTLARIVELMPFECRYNVGVHLKGTFDISGQYLILSFTGPGKVFLFGEDDVVIIDDNSGSKYTSTGATNKTIDDSTAGWTPDEFAGYWVRIIDGPQAGAMATIVKNTSTSIQFCRKLSGSPGTGVQFEIVRPTTHVTASSFGYLEMRSSNPFQSFGISRVYFSGTSRAHYVGGSPNLEGLVFDADPGRDMRCYNAAGVYGSSWTYLPDFTYDSVSQLGLGTRRELTVIACYNMRLYSAYIYGMTISNSEIAAFNGNRVRNKATLWHVKTVAGEDGIKVDNNSPIGASFEDSPESGLEAVNCDILMQGEVDFSNNADHGILAERSKIKLTGAITSDTVNGKSGVYAYSHSAFLTAAGSPPSISGTTIGNNTTDGSTLGETWANIEAGTPKIDADEFTHIKKL